MEIILVECGVCPLTLAGHIGGIPQQDMTRVVAVCPRTLAGTLGIFPNKEYRLAGVCPRTLKGGFI